MRTPVNGDRRRRLIVGFLIGSWTLVLVAGCASGAAGPAEPAGAGGQGAPAARAPAPAASAASGQDQSGSGSGSGSNVGNGGDDVAVLNDAKIVRTGSLELQVTDVGKALTSGRDAVRSFGGYIGASQQQRSGDQTVASVTYRIPVSRWDEAMDALRGLGTVISEKTDAQEVTDQIVDLDARIRNLKASEQALVGYAEKAPKVSDLLEIQSRLTDTRGEIERLSAQQANLTNQAALATLSVTFGVKPVEVTKTTQGWDPAAEVDRASATLIGLGQSIVSFAIVLAIVWLPILVVVGIVAIVGLTLARRLGWRRPTDPPPFVPPAVSPQA